MRNLLVSIIVFFAVGLSAQSSKKLSISISGAGNLSIPCTRKIGSFTNIENHPITTFKSTVGYSFELGFGYALNSALSFKSGIGFISHNINFNDVIGAREARGILKTSYLHIPLMVEYKIQESPFSVSVGPYVGFLINASEKGTYTVDPSQLTFSETEDILLETIIWDVDFDQNLNNYYSKHDIGISTQISYEFVAMNKVPFFLFTRFNYGLIDTISDKKKTRLIKKRWNNIGLLFGVGTSFKL